MVESFKNIFAIPDLRKRVLFTLAILGVYRIGSVIPTPGVNTDALAILVEQAAGTMFGLYNMFSGGNLAQATIFALGIMPYISASIILQLLTVVWPYLERLSKEGELGRRKDHAVHALRNHPAVHRAVDGDRHLPRTPDEHRGRVAAGLRAPAGRSAS